MHTRVGKSRSLAAAHWTATVCSSNLQPATANPQQPATCNSQLAATCNLQQPTRSNLQPAAASDRSNLQPATACNSNLQQQLTAAAAYSKSIVAASDDFAVSTEDAVTHQECPFITSNIYMCEGCPTFREKRRNIILLLKDFIIFWSMLHFTFWS